MTMTIDEAFDVINNLDFAEGLRRKFAPGFSLLLIDRMGEVVRIERFKQPPSETQQAATLNLQVGCIAIDGSPGMYESPEALQQRIADSMWIFDTLIRKPQGSSQE